MKTCDTCKHWNALDNPRLGPIEGVCSKLSDPKATGDTDFLINDGGDTGKTITGHRFGCVHHEPAITPADIASTNPQK